MSFNLVLDPDAPSSWMKRVFGTETEYGITVNGVESVDVVTESIELVRCYTEHGALMKSTTTWKIRTWTHVASVLSL